MFSFTKICPLFEFGSQSADILHKELRAFQRESPRKSASCQSCRGKCRDKFYSPLVSSVSSTVFEIPEQNRLYVPQFFRYWSTALAVTTGGNALDLRQIKISTVQCNDSYRSWQRRHSICIFLKHTGFEYLAIHSQSHTANYNTFGKLS